MSDQEKEELRLLSIEEYYVALEALEKLLEEGATMKDPRAQQLEHLLNAFEEEMFPLRKGSPRLGGRF